MRLSLDHIQLAIPVGEEDRARAFWCDLLGFTEVEKPPTLAARGGAWFVHGTTTVHVGVEEPFVAAAKAHPAFLVSDLNDLAKCLAAKGFQLRWDREIIDTVRFHVNDPFGNRLEFISE